MSKVRATFETPDLAIADKVQELATMLLDMGVELEYIKISAPLYVDGKEISSVSGVRVKHITRNGIDIVGKFKQCECGFKFYEGNFEYSLPTNSTDNELEDVPKLENDDMYILQNIITDYVTISGDELFDLAQAIRAKYISRKEVEEAIDSELATCPPDEFLTDSGHSRKNALLDIRAKLLPPTKGDNDE